MADPNNITMKPTRILPMGDITVLTNTIQTLRFRTLKNIHAIYAIATKAGVDGVIADFTHDMNYINLALGTVDIRQRLTPQQYLDHWNFYNTQIGGALTVAAALPLFWTPTDFTAEGEATYYRLGCKANADPQDSTARELTIEISYKNIALTLDKISLYCEVDDDNPELLGDHIKILQKQSTFATTGQQHITDWDLDKPNRLLRALHFPVTTGTIVDFEVFEDAIARYRPITISNLKLLQKWCGLIAQTNIQSLIWNNRNSPAGALPLNTVKTLEVVPNWSVTPNGAYTILQEVIDRGL